jgi:2-methylcitrate dehydratase PrpD
MTILESFAERLLELDPRQMSPADRVALDTHVLDTAAALLTGAATPEGSAAIGLDARGLGSALDAIAAQVAATRSTEVDDIHLPSGTTPGAIVVPTALGLAGHLNITDTNLIYGAIAAGYEAMTRLGAAIQGQSILYQGVWATYFCAPFAAAAVASRLLALDADEMAHALAIALPMAAGRAGPSGGTRTARWLLAGDAARMGCKAALAAADGYTGETALLDGLWLGEAHGIVARSGAILAGLDRGSVLSQISIKPYCSARQVLGAICAFEEILARGIDPKGIESVQVMVPSDFVAMIDHGVIAGNRLSSISSAPYQLALAAFHPDGLFDVARERVQTSDDIVAFMTKVSVTADDELDRHLPEHWPASLEVKVGGRSETTLVLDAPGDPSRPYTFDDVGRKFHALADRLVGADKVDAWVTNLDLSR